jgi:hypothetical protein
LTKLLLMKVPLHFLNCLNTFKRNTILKSRWFPQEILLFTMHIYQEISTKTDLGKKLKTFFFRFQGRLFLQRRNTYTYILEEALLGKTLIFRCQLLSIFSKNDS